jgi:hypothetical protein
MIELGSLFHKGVSLQSQELWLTLISITASILLQYCKYRCDSFVLYAVISHYACKIVSSIYLEI